MYVLQLNTLKKSIIFPSEKGISSHQRIEPSVPSISKTGYPQKE